jgi:aconitate hydratase
MSASLARQIIDLHRAPGGAPRPAPGDDLAVLVDHVIVDGMAAGIVFLAFEATGAARTVPELVLACAERNGGSDPIDPKEAVALGEAATRAGAVWSRAGNGAAHQVHAARHAQPGRVGLGLDPSIAACGAFAMLGFTAPEIEVAAALAGCPHVARWPSVVGLELIGRPPSWLGGDDLALAIARLLAERRPDDVVECRGEALAGLGMPVRIGAARALAALGAGRLLFPSDAATRRHLQALGRESDWKALAPDEKAEYDRTLVLDVGVVEPLVLRTGDPGPTILREHLGHPVHAVVIGPESGVAGLELLAARIRGHGCAARGIVVAPAGRALERAADAVPALRAAGVRFVEESTDLRTVLEPGPGAILVHGFATCEGPRELTGLGNAHIAAGLSTCASSLVEGVLSDPRRLEPDAVAAPAGPAAEIVFAADEGLIVRPPAAGAETAPRRGSHPPLTLGRPLEGPLRGVVLLKLGDDASAERLLPWGARVRRHQTDVDTLAEWALAGVDPAFARRAAEEGGGFLVAGHGCGDGMMARPHPALIAPRLGLRAVLARSFGREFHHQLVLHGVLPLRFTGARDLDLVDQGDELEVPDLPDGLEPRKPLVVRNLTRGSQLALRHDLNAREVSIVRAGGLLRVVLATRRAA